jgi:hypothetical protein
MYNVCQHPLSMLHPPSQHLLCHLESLRSVLRALSEVDQLGAVFGLQVKQDRRERGAAELNVSAQQYVVNLSSPPDHLNTSNTF